MKTRVQKNTATSHAASLSLSDYRTKIIRRATKVGEISMKVQESRLNVLRREDERLGKRVMGMEVPGK